MEFRREELYEGESHERLDKIIITINQVLLKYGGNVFENAMVGLNEIRANLTWDGYDSIDGDRASQILQNVLHLLIKSKTIINEFDYSAIEQIIEPLEICITELKMGYCD